MFNCSVKGLEREERRGERERNRRREGEGKRERRKGGRKTHAAALLGDLSSNPHQQSQETAVWMREARAGEQRDSEPPWGFGFGKLLTRTPLKQTLVPRCSGAINSW